MALTFGKAKRRFSVGPQQVELRSRVTGKSYRTAMMIDGVEVAFDETLNDGPEAFRNHHVETVLADGRTLSVEAGYVGWWSMGLRSRVGDEIIDDSHPGKVFAYPEGLKKIVHQPDYDANRQKANLVPISVDIALGLIFFVVARATDLTTAALVGAGLGAGLLVVQRFVKADLVGGLALFGVVMLGLSAGLALIFDSGTMVQMRTTIIGLISAACFLIDGWRGGGWLGRGLSRYIPYADVDLRTLALGMGTLGAIMAVLNLVVIAVASEDIWLIYSTFLDIPLVMVGFWFVMQRARRRPA
jgi:intracellular septation protein A